MAESVLKSCNVTTVLNKEAILYSISCFAEISLHLFNNILHEHPSCPYSEQNIFVKSDLKQFCTKLLVR